MLSILSSGYTKNGRLSQRHLCYYGRVCYAMVWYGIWYGMCMICCALLPSQHLELPKSLSGAGLMGAWLNGYLALRRSIHFIMSRLTTQVHVIWHGMSFQNVMSCNEWSVSILSLRIRSNWGSQIPEPLLGFTSKCPLTFRMAQGLCPFFKLQLLKTGRTARDGKKGTIPPKHR